MSNFTNTPDDHLEVTQALEQHRPTLNALELDVLKRRVLRGSRTTATTSTNGAFMRSRTAITALLTSGLLLSGGGTALGVSALQSTGNPAVAQYGVPGVPPAPTLGGTPPAVPGTPPAVPGTPPAVPGTPPADIGDVADESANGVTPEPTTPDEGAVAAESTSGGNPTPVQASRQIATVSGDSLPFTGYASIPVLMLGMTLFAAGLVMRRRSVQL